LKRVTLEIGPKKQFYSEIFWTFCKTLYSKKIQPNNINFRFRFEIFLMEMGQIWHDDREKR